MIHLPRVIAHRGAPLKAPENSLLSLRVASDCGAGWVEFDVQLTSDGVVVVFHDTNLWRMTGKRASLKRCSMKKLQSFSIGRKADARFINERIPTLEAWLLVAAKLGIGINIELKGRFQYQLVQKTLALLHAHWSVDLPSPLLSSFNMKALQYLSTLHLPVHFAVLLDRWPKRGLPKIIDNPYCYSVHLDHTIVTEKRINILLGLGKKVCCYTVNDKALAERLFFMGVSSVFSDDVTLLDDVNAP